jgi:hypothetical protein
MFSGGAVGMIGFVLCCIWFFFALITGRLRDYDWPVKFLGVVGGFMFAFIVVLLWQFVSAP